MYYNATKKNIELSGGRTIEIETGKKLGEHSGHFQYTIGQRKGIGLAHPHPLYVLDTDAEKNIVYVGREELSHKNTVQATDINLSFPLEETVFDAMVKIRYNMPAQKARVTIKNGTISAAFYESVNSVTAGQSLVIYDEAEGFLIGGGTIY